MTQKRNKQPQIGNQLYSEAMLIKAFARQVSADIWNFFVETIRLLMGRQVEKDPTHTLKNEYIFWEIG